MMIENIHSEVYSQLIDTLIRDPQEKNNTFNAIISDLVSYPNIGALKFNIKLIMNIT